MANFAPTATPWPMVATVVQQVGQSYGLFVTLKNTGAGVPRYVQVLGKGPNDALRIKQDPLPARGTSGLVVFPHGDSRNGVWLGSIAANLQNAITTDNSDPFATYESDWSGGWRLRDSQGNWCDYYPDGSSIVFSASGEVPETYRNTATPNGPQTRESLSQATRRPSVASPFTMAMTLASGATVNVDASGNITVVSPDAVDVTASSVTVNAATITLNGDVIINGNLNVSDQTTTASLEVG